VGREYGISESVLAIECLLGLRAPGDLGYIDPDLYVRASCDSGCTNSAVHASCFRCRLHCQCHGGG
jgi:hypothetical protein